MEVKLTGEKIYDLARCLSNLNIFTSVLDVEPMDYLKLEKTITEYYSADKGTIFTHNTTDTQKPPSIGLYVTGVKFVFVCRKATVKGRT